MEQPDEPGQVGSGQEVHVIADAAQAAADETADAIDNAAKLNHDPAVGRALDEAALKADKTSGRVSWLRAFIGRLFERQPKLT
jgi:hypothetical protein